jgi:hypothetical protein
MADVRVTDLPAASSLANGDVLHGVQAADNQDKKFSLSDLSTFFASGVPVTSVFGRTGAVVAANGDYDIGELGDVDLSVAPTSGQFLKWDGSNWTADDVPAAVVDLGYSSASGNGTITNTAGTNATIPGATTLSAGLFSATDKVKLNGIATGAEVNVPTNLSYSTAASTGTVNSSTGTNATIPAATTSAAGLLTSSDKTKLDGIAAGAQVNVATNLAQGTRTTTTVPVTSSTGTDATLSAATTSLAGVMSSADKSKLDGIAAGATNVTDNNQIANGRGFTTNTGTVTSVSGGTGLTGTVTTSGSINLANTAVSAGSYTLANITVDAQGRITSASNGSAGSGSVTSIATSAPITGGTITTSGTIGISAATTSAAGSMSAADKTKLDGIATGATANTGTVTSIATSGAITGGTITTSGTITARNASTSQTGVVQLNNSTSSTSTSQAATANAVKVAWDLANSKTSNTGTVTSVATSGALTGGTITTSGTLSVRNGTTSQTGVVQLSTSTSSTSTTLAATPSAVKTAVDNAASAQNTANTANTTANAALARTGGTMTGGVYQTVRTITSGAAWDLSTGNFWEFAGGTIANPSNATAGMSGLIRVTDPISGWGTNFDFPGGTAVAPTTFPAIIPWYVSATNVIMIGTPIEGIT